MGCLAAFLASTHDLPHKLWQPKMSPNSVDPRTTQGLGPLTPAPCSWKSMYNFIVGPRYPRLCIYGFNHLWTVQYRSTYLLKKNPRISGLAQFKPTLFKGPLYFRCRLWGKITPSLAPVIFKLRNFYGSFFRFSRDLLPLSQSVEEFLRQRSKSRNTKFGSSLVA